MQNNAPFNSKKFFTGLFIVLALLLVLSRLLDQWLIPNLYRNLADLAGRMPQYLESITQWADGVIAQSGLQFSQNAAQMINTLAQKLGEHFASHAEEYAQMASRTIFGLFGALFDFFLGMLVAFYLLLTPQRYKRLAGRMLTAIINEPKKRDGIKRFLRETDVVLGKYITGRLIETAILGVLCFIGLSIFGVDYSLIMAVTVALTNLIPYFGPWLGAVPVVLLAFLNNPASALWLAIFLLVLQIIDNYIVSPKILGDMLEVSALWILVGVIVGGGMFGLWGMLLGAPAMSILSGLWNRFFKWRAGEQAKKEQDGPAL